MAKTTIQSKVREMLFGKAAGRCEYRGCNDLLTVDYLTQRSGKFSAFAHIIADSPDGPRGDPILSEKCKSEISNIMLLCLGHHKLIDVDDKDGHSVELLQEMKREHEARIERMTGIDANHKTVVLVMEGNIGSRKGLVDRKQVAQAVLPMYPAEKVFSIDLAHLSLTDGDPSTWDACKREITLRLGTLQHELVRAQAKHVSVFALAPMPLLMWLGRELGNLVGGIAFQKHREPEGWQWQDPPKNPVTFGVTKPDEFKNGEDVALVLSISDEISSRRLKKASVDTSQWYHIRAVPQSVHAVRTPADVGAFRAVARAALSEISKTHPGAKIHVFPAAPNSLCVEFGRLLLPKADPTLVIYDWNTVTKGWMEAVTLVRQPN